MSVRNQTIYALVEASRLGWFAVAGDEEAIRYVTIGHATEADARTRLSNEVSDIEFGSQPPSILKHSVDEIARYLAGEPVDLATLPIATGRRTPFQERVVRALRQVPYGQTVSYADLAEQACAPRAARAVGTVMSTNRLPLLIPCHRVVGSGGRLGGFSAPQGINLKRSLLAMEAGEPLDIADVTADQMDRSRQGVPA